MHLDNHFAVSNRKNKNKVLSRKWYQAEDEWMKQVEDVVIESPGAIFFSQMTTVTESETDGNRDESEGVPVDEDQPVCIVCHEKFELKRDLKTDDWIYEDTFKHEATGVITHKSCMPIYTQRLAPSHDVQIHKIQCLY